MRWNRVLFVVAVAVLGSVQLAAGACPALTVNFFPEGSKNVPSGWTREAQVAAGNEDTSSLNTVTLTASPPPKLFVQPVHPLFSRKACVPADCLPAAKGRRLQGDYGRSRITPLTMSDEDEDPQPHVVAETQRLDSESAVVGRFNPFFWNLAYNPFGRRGDSNKGSSSSNSGAASPSTSTSSPPSSSSTPAANSEVPSSGPSTDSTNAGASSSTNNATPSPSPSPSSNSTSSSPPSSPEKLEQGVDTGSLASSGSHPKQIAAADGSGSSGIKDSIAAGGDGSSSGRTGWTTWRDGQDDWWTGEERSLAACLTTVAQPASYDILWNIDGGIAKKATMPKEGAPFILLNNLDTLAPGKHTLYIKATMMKNTAEVNGVPSLQPPADQVYTTKVVFNLVEGKGDGTASVEPSVPAAKPGDKPAGDKPPAGQPAGEKPASEGQEKPADAGKPAEGAAPPEGTKDEKKPGEDKKDDKKGPDVKAEPTIDATVAQQAVKYYCMRQYNVGGKIHSSKNVSPGDEGVNQCAVACNALRQDCSGFGVSGNKCFLMKAFNTTSSSADATLDALCMKNANDWLDFGLQTSANKVGSGFFCLRGFDIKGDPAGTGDMENPVQTANTELAGMTPSTCGTQCKATAGCQFFILKKSTTPGGAATCYLKMHALGGLYGNTGPAKDTLDFTCFNGQEGWMTFGGQLDYAVPSPEVNTGVQTPALAAVLPATGPAATTGAKTYRCIKGYLVNGTTMTEVQVSMGDEGLSQCAGKCDTEAGCVAYSMTEAGMCTLLKTISFNTSAASAKTYGMCFGDPADWNKFGNPDGSGMFCIKNYDFAGDGVRTVDYITITSGAGAVQFCKQQCSAEPQCQFSVTSLGKCYMKQNILSGSFGTTKPDTAVDATCVKGEQNWALAALQVSAAPAGGLAGRNMTRGAGNSTARRSSLGKSAADAAQPGWVVLLMSSIVAALLSVCFMQA